MARAPQFKSIQKDVKVPKRLPISSLPASAKELTFNDFSPSNTFTLRSWYPEYAAKIANNGIEIIVAVQPSETATNGRPRTPVPMISLNKINVVPKTEVLLEPMLSLLPRSVMLTVIEVSSSIALCFVFPPILFSPVGISLEEVEEEVVDIIIV
jgi:hypothetical protein